MNHPGWYKLIWLESIGGTPSPDVIKILHIPSQGFTDGIMKASKNGITKEKALSVGNILTCYLHGELCIWINNRSL